MSIFNKLHYEVNVHNNTDIITVFNAGSLQQVSQNK